MDATERSGVISFAQAQAQISRSGGEHAVLVLRRGTLDLKLSLPVAPNRQTPHTQDELYVVIRGRGILVHDGARSPFEAGDVLFVAAGCAHHYEDFGPDLALWRVFYGADGGEVPQ
ncbi:MAG TPA: cupin domain-containing protein [Pseudomonadales bacterium]